MNSGLAQINIRLRVNFYILGASEIGIRFREQLGWKLSNQYSLSSYESVAGNWLVMVMKAIRGAYYWGRGALRAGRCHGPRDLFI